MLNWFTRLFKRQIGSDGAQLRAHRRIRGRYDAAVTNSDNYRHWANADGLSADAAASPEVRRILRNRARYEVANKPLDMAGFLNDRCELVGFGNGAPRHFSNAVLASRPGGIAKEALQRAIGLVKRPPAWQQIPYGSTGQGILAALLPQLPDCMHRCARWRYAYIHFQDVAKFNARNSDWNFDYVSYWNPNACCYHLTGKGLVPFHEMSREQLLSSNTFAGFLFRRALGLCRPKRSEAICRRLPTDRPIRGVEVGVLRGRNARVLLQQRPLLHLTLVDLWSQQPLDGSYVQSGDAHARKSPAAWERIYQAARRSTAFASDRVEILRMDSLEAVKRQADRSLDFVFIDGDHSYEGCKRDIEAWAPKVKPGGWIGGHDYSERWGVKKTVDQWTRMCDLSLEHDHDLTWFMKID